MHLLINLNLISLVTAIFSLGFVIANLLSYRKNWVLYSIISLSLLSISSFFLIRHLFQQMYTNDIRDMIWITGVISGQFLIFSLTIIVLNFITYAKNRKRL